LKAIIQHQYGSPDKVLQLQEIDKPTIADDEVLVRVRATSVHTDVWHVITGKPYILRLMGAGLRKPKNPIPGTDLAGTIEAVGKNVTRFKIGDDVFGESHKRFQWVNGGTFAEYAAVPQEMLALKPKNISFEQAAAIPTPGFIALFNLINQGKLKAGHNVLINGAGGNVGSVSLQIAKAYGARVTGIDHTDKLDMLRALGADRVIDYTKEDFTQGSERYDLILDVASNLLYSDCKPMLTPKGMYVFVGHDHFGKLGRDLLGGMWEFLKLSVRALFDHHIPGAIATIPKKPDVIAELKTLLEEGKLTPIVDKTFPLSETIAAMHYLQEGKSRGKIIITI
jgi:NADPH:quinone reductase-like Zn-dependent oxidoreductase